MASPPDSPTTAAQRYCEENPGDDACACFNSSDLIAEQISKTREANAKGREKYKDDMDLWVSDKAAKQNELDDYHTDMHWSCSRGPKGHLGAPLQPPHWYKKRPHNSDPPGVCGMTAFEYDYDPFKKFVLVSRTQQKDRHGHWTHGTCFDTCKYSSHGIVEEMDKWEGANPKPIPFVPEKIGNVAAQCCVNNIEDVAQGKDAAQTCRQNIIQSINNTMQEKKKNAKNNNNAAGNHTHNKDTVPTTKKKKRGSLYSIFNTMKLHAVRSLELMLRGANREEIDGGAGVIVMLLIVLPIVVVIMYKVASK
jgi:hypothetical protein